MCFSQCDLGFTIGGFCDRSDAAQPKYSNLHSEGNVFLLDYHEPKPVCYRKAKFFRQGIKPEMKFEQINVFFNGCHYQTMMGELCLAKG